MLATDVRSLFVWQLDRDEGQKKQFSLPFSLLLSFFHARGRACARAHTHSADVASQYFAVWQRGISSTIVIKFRYFLFTPVSPKVLTCSSVCSDFFFYFVDLRGCQEVDNEQVFKGASCFLLEGARSSKGEKTLEGHYISGKRSGLKVGGRSVCPIAFCDFIFCTYVGHLKQLE